MLCPYGENSQTALEAPKTRPHRLCSPHDCQFGGGKTKRSQETRNVKPDSSVSSDVGHRAFVRDQKQEWWLLLQTENPIQASGSIPWEER